MQLGARWLGVGSIVVGTVTAAVLGMSLVPREQPRPADESWREYTWLCYTSDPRLENETASLDVIDACLARNSDWLRLDRTERGVAVWVHEHTAMQRCLDQLQLVCGRSRQPEGVVYHRAEDFQPLTK